MLEIRRFTSKMLLALTLILSLMAPSIVNAYDTIGSPEEASITIYKYQQEPGTPAGNAGDGSLGQMLAGAVGIEGVTFTLTLLETFNPATNEWAPAPAGTVLTGITDATGKVVFNSSNGLVLGRYNVAETDGPEHVILNIIDYKVDVPMTNNEGTELNYNVYIYPKNDIIREDVELIKKDQEGNVLPNVHFDLYKVESTGDTKINTAGDLITNAEGKINVDNLDQGKYYFIETAVPAGYALNNTKIYFDIMKVDGNGNYDVLGQFIAIKWIDVAGFAVDGTVTNYDIPTVEKDAEGQQTYFEDRDKTFRFNLEFTTPLDIAKYASIDLTDVLDNRLQLVSDDAAYLNGWEIVGAPRDAVTFTQVGQELKWAFDPAKLIAGNVLTITFTAKIKADAVLNPGETGIPNTVDLNFDNNRGQSGKTFPDNPVIVIPKDGGFMLTKVDKANADNKLAGAEFKLTTDAAGLNVLDATGKVIKVNGILHTGLLQGLTTRANGTFTIDGLTPGTYYLHETKAPTYTDTNNIERSYRLLTSPVEVIIVDSDELIDVTVQNAKSGFVLPVTGGIGTVLFTTAGLSMMGIALYEYLRRRRAVEQ